MKFGLDNIAIKKVNNVFQRFQEVEKVILFGSRAKGNYRASSDVDITLVGSEVNIDIYNKIASQIDDLLLPYHFDISIFKHIENNELIAHIKRVGKVFYERANITSNNDWIKYKLGDVCIKIGSGATPKGGKESYLSEGDIALIRSQNVLDFFFSKDGLAFINQDQAAKLNNVTVQHDDVLLNITGDSVARVCQVPSEILPARVNQHVAIIRPNREKLDNAYLKYYLLNPSFKNFMLGLSSVGGTRNALTKVMIEDFEIEVPSLNVQRRIAQILSSIDNKIELNRQTNQTLEAIAQAIFKEWFVDFNFPGATGELVESELGMIPKGWRVYKLGELIDSVSITHKFPKDKVIFLNTGDIEEGKLLHRQYTDVAGLPGQAKKSIKKLDILFTEIRPANKRYALIDFVADDYVVSTKLMVLRTTSSVHPIVIYNYLTSVSILSELQHLAESRSGTFPQITFSQVKELKVVLPEGELLKQYEKLAWSIFQRLKNNEEQTETLVQLRDTLLPKLMKGEIGVI